MNYPIRIEVKKGNISLVISKYVKHNSRGVSRVNMSNWELEALLLDCEDAMKKLANG